MIATTESLLAELMDRVTSQYFGKYRGTVVDNADPQQLGRLRVHVPTVLGVNVVTGWALPCVPYGGAADQGFLFVPEVGAGVWIEFEEGDLEFPVWVGTYWGRPGHQSELPRSNDASGAEAGSVQTLPSRKIIKTVKGHTLQFEDANGSEMITLVEAVHDHRITLNADGITITDGLHTGNTFTMDSGGITIADCNGNRVILGPGGIQIGSGEAVEPLVLGASLKVSVESFVTALRAHTHISSAPGVATAPMLPPPVLNVPLSPKHKTE